MSAAHDPAAWPIHSRRTVIRCVEAADMVPLCNIVTLPQVARMLFLFRPDMPLEEFTAHFPTGSTTPPFRAVVELDGRCVGSIGVGEGDSPAIWYFLDPSVAGMGLASEIVPAFVAWLDARFGYAVIEAEVFNDNPASRRVLEKAGFACVGTSEHSSGGRAEPATVWLFERRR